MKKIILFMLIFTMSFTTFSDIRYKSRNNYDRDYRRKKSDKEKKYEELYWPYDKDIREIEREIRRLDNKIMWDIEDNRSNSYDLVKRKQLETKMYNRTVRFRNDLRKHNLFEYL